MDLAYATELSLEQYELFESLVSPSSSTGRPRRVNLMRVIQAILSVLVSGWEKATLAQRVSALLNGLVLLPQVAQRRELETYP